MQKVTLRCSCGHSWEQSLDGDPPADVSSLCPLCTSSNQGTVDSALSDLPEPAEGEGEGEGKEPGAAVLLKPGEMLAGFEILEELARGGMGAIYKARQAGLNRIVALKVILPERLGPEALRRFQREVRAAALLSHPNIVMVYHTDLEGPRPYLAMEYVPGIDLWRLVKKAGARGVREACIYIRDAAQGLQHAYEQGLVHRDIKPSNLMVSPSPLEPAASSTAGPRKPMIKILDMGLARVATIEDMGEAATSLTQDGIFLGTPDYISPEQAEDARSVDIRSDLFSLGGTLYYLLVGDVPYPGGSLMQKLRRLLTDTTPSAMARRPEVPAELDAIVQKMMAREPADRFQTPAEVIAALDAFLRKPSGTAPRLAAKLGGSASFTTSGQGGYISLYQQGNEFGGDVSLAVSKTGFDSVTIFGSGAGGSGPLTLGTVTLGSGYLGVTNTSTSAGSGIREDPTQGGITAAAGNADTITFNVSAANADIDLSAAPNNLPAAMYVTLEGAGTSAGSIGFRNVNAGASQAQLQVYSYSLVQNVTVAFDQAPIVLTSPLTIAGTLTLVTGGPIASGLVSKIGRAHV